MRRRRLTRSVRLAALLVLLGAAVWFSWRYISQERSIAEAQTRIDELNAELDALRLRAVALQSDLDFAQTDAYIERMAREELGYVRQGEILFVASEDAQAQPEEETEVQPRMELPTASQAPEDADDPESGEPESGEPETGDPAEEEEEDDPA